MATLGSLIVQIGGDNRGLTQALRESAHHTRDFIRNAMEGVARDQSSVRAVGAEIATNLVDSLESRFRAEMVEARQALFQGLIDKAEFQRRGQEAAAAFNAGITTGITNLQFRGALTPTTQATLVSKYKDAGLQAGKAMIEGVEQGTRATGAFAEQTGKSFERLRSRIGPASVAVVFGIEAMVRGAEAGEAGIRTAFRAIATAAAAFGPEGIVVSALIGFGIAAYEHFSRARKEAEKTARAFATTAAEIARSGDVMRAAQLQQKLFSGDPFAAFDAKPEGETEAQFVARAEGIIGLRKRIADISRQELEFNKRARSGELSPQQINAMTWGKGGLAEQLKFRREMVDVLRTLDAQYEKIGQVADIVNKKEGELAQNNLNRLREAAQKKASEKAARVDPVDQLGAFVSQIESSRRTLERLGETTTGLGPAIGKAYGQVTAMLLKATDPLDQATLRLEEIRNRLVALMTGPVPAISDLAHPDRFGGLTPEAREMKINDESIRKLQDAIAKAPPKVSQLPAQTQVGRLDVLQAQIIGVFETVGNTITAQMVAMFGPVAIVMRIIQPALEILAPLLDALVRPLVMVAQVLAAGLEPAFRLLYPIIRAVAVAASYVAQIFYNIAAAVTRFIGNLIIGFGNVVKAIATAIDKIPGINARGAIKAGQGIIDMGESMLTTADAFTKAANDMGNIRKQLAGMGWDEAKQGVDELGKSARETADALRNVPTWIRVNLEAWLAAHVTDPVQATGPGGVVPPRGSPIPTRPVGGGAPPPPMPNPGGFIPEGVQVSSISVGNVTVIAKDDPQQTWKDMVAAARRQASATFGDAGRWSELRQAGG